MTGFKSTIHHSSIIAPSAQLPSDIQVGAFCVIEDDVVLGTGCRIGNRVTIRSGAKLDKNNHLGDGTVIGGATKLGANNIIHENCVIGGAPLVHGSDGQAGHLEIGSHNSIRELSTIQVGSSRGQATRIGNENYLMASVQVGHDGQLGNRVTLSNYCALAGHVIIEDDATLGLGVIVHQFCRVGCLAMVGASAYVSQDIAPFVLVDGRSSKVVGLNSVGLKRAGVDEAQKDQLKQAFRMVFLNDLPWQEIVTRLNSDFSGDMASRLATFLSKTTRGWTRHRSKSSGNDV